MRATRRRIACTCSHCGRTFSTVIDLEFPTLSHEALDVCGPCAHDDAPDAPRSTIAPREMYATTEGDPPF